MCLYFGNSLHNSKLKMTDCPFTLNADGLWQCPDCGWVYPRKKDKPPRRNCPKKKAPPTPEQKAEAERQQRQANEAGKALGWRPEHAIKYARALTRWIAAGRPTRDDEEVAEIVAVCETCDKYKADKSRCSVCGCKVHTPGITILSKAKLGTERCHKDKW